MKRIFKVRGFDELLRAEGRVVTAFSLSRLLHHIKSGKPFAILTAWKSVDAEGFQVPPEVNKANMANLVKDLRSLGLGFVPLSGAGQEEGGAVSYEPSFFVPGISKEDAIRLGDKYNQYAVLWGKEGDSVSLILNDGSEILLEDRPVFDRNKIEQYWSEWRGRAFSFLPKKEKSKDDDQGSGGPTKKESSQIFILPDNLMSSWASYLKLRDELCKRYGESKVSKALEEINKGRDPKDVVREILWES